MSPEQQVCIALHHYGSQPFQQTTGLSFNVSECCPYRYHESHGSFTSSKGGLDKAALISGTTSPEKYNLFGFQIYEINKDN